MKKILLTLIGLSLLLSSCGGKPRNVIDVKSPCVSTDDGPCGPKRSVNDWWLKQKV